MRPLCGLIGLVLAAVLWLLPLAPPIHAHEAHQAGEHHTIVHRHGGGHDGQDHEHGESSLDHDAAAVSLDDGLYDVPPSSDLLSASVPATHVRYVPPVVPAPRARLGDPLIHAPPRASLSLRAPPTFLA